MSNFAKYFMSRPASLTSVEIGQSMTERREHFMIRAHACGLTLEQAEALLRSDYLIASISGRSLVGGAEERLMHLAQYGYLTVLLGEVLTPDELKQQAFSFETVLNGDMDRAYAKHFAELSCDKQRGLTKAGIELALQTDWPLERAMAAVMPYVEGA